MRRRERSQAPKIPPFHEFWNKRSKNEGIEGLRENDFMMIVTRVDPKANPNEMLNVFKKFDENRNGMLEFPELTNLHKTMSEMDRRARENQRRGGHDGPDASKDLPPFHEFWNNHQYDGKNEWLYQDGFERAYHNMKIMVNPEHANDWFRRGDGNGDGRLDFAEM